MLSGVFIAIGVYLLIFGPIPVGIPLFNQILGLILIVGGAVAGSAFRQRMVRKGAGHIG